MLVDSEENAPIGELPANGTLAPAIPPSIEMASSEESDSVEAAAHIVDPESKPACGCAGATLLPLGEYPR